MTLRDQWWHVSGVLRSPLLLSVVMITLPLTVFAAAIVYLLWQQQLEQFEQQQLATARAIARAVEKEISSTVRQLEYIATSPQLTQPDLESFREMAERALATTQQWSNVIVFDPAGRQLFNARFATPSKQAPEGQLHISTVVATKRPQVSDLFTGPASGRWVVAVSVPVLRDGAVTHVLSVSLRLEALDVLVAESGTSAPVVAIWDSRQRLISRSLHSEEFRGKEPVPALTRDARIKPEGWGRYTTHEGREVFSAWAQVPSTRWTIGIAVPSAAAYAALHKYLWVLALVEALILLTALPFALRLSREARERARAEGERDRLLVLESEARAAAEMANRAKDEFLAMLGHELRNPLAAVSNAVQLLDQDQSATRESIFARGVIRRQTQHLARLIDDLLDVGRVITGKIYLQREPIDLASAVEDALATVRGAGHVASHNLTVRTEPVYIEADRTRVEQIVINLVSNALAHTPAGGSVDVSAVREGSDAVLTVSDTGVGVAKEELGRLFDLFFQGTARSNRQGGLGIGLTLVRRLAELHGGSVAVQSEGPGRGARFVVRLPAIEAPATAAEATAVVAQLHEPRTVLIVEDNTDARDSLKRVLEHDGHVVHEAPDGAAGVQMGLHWKPAVAVVDIGLPVLDGYGVARELRAQLGTSIKLIALTGYGQPEDARRAREAGFDVHLTKPADVERLRALIATSERRAQRVA